MNVTVVGSGNMGSSFVKRLSASGHRVLLTGRNAAKTAELAHNHGAKVVGAAEAAASEVIIVATAYGDAVDALRPLGSLDGRIVVDITNPLTADYMGLTIGHTTSAAEEMARAFPAARVVKAFNTVFAQVLAAGGNFGNGQTVPVFVAGDEAPAREVVSNLARSMGFDVIDAGALKNSRYLEPVGGLNVYLGYGAGLGTSIAPTWLRKA